MSEIVKVGEDQAGKITGEGIELGGDALIYFKMAAFEQGALTRLGSSTEFSLEDEIWDRLKYPGYIYLGELGALETELHTQITNLFKAIRKHRGLQEATVQEATDEGASNEN